VDVLPPDAERVLARAMGRPVLPGPALRRSNACGNVSDAPVGDVIGAYFLSVGQHRRASSGQPWGTSRCQRTIQL